MKPTIEELLNAGAKHEGCTLYTLKNEASSFEFYLNKTADSFRVYYEEKMLVQNKYPTKEELKTAVKILWGEDLDFEPKEKDYSWKAVVNRMSQHELDVAYSIITPLEDNRKVPSGLKNYLLAIMKLRHIIDEINKDFPMVGDSFYEIHQNGGKLISLCSMYSNPKASGFMIKVLNKEGAEALIKYNEDLIKQALEWK